MFALGLRSLRKIFACGPAIIRPRCSGSLRQRMIWHHRLVIALLQISLRHLADLLALTAMAFRRRRATAAEILVLQRQLALYKERGAKPRRIDAATRISLVLLSRFCNWREALIFERSASLLRWLWSAKIESCIDRREEVFVMQSAKDRLGSDGVRLFAMMARSRFLIVAIRWGRIGNTQTQRHVRTSGIVMGNAELQNRSQMRFGQRDQPIQTLATNRTGDSFADRIGHRTSRGRSQHRDSEFFHGLVEVLGEGTVAIV